MFSINFGNHQMTDQTAIEQADEIFNKKLLDAKPGEQVSMTLWCNREIVKNYPAQQK